MAGLPPPLPEREFRRPLRMFIAGSADAKKKKTRFEYILVDDGLGLYRAERKDETWWLWQSPHSRSWYAGTDKEGGEKLTPETWSSDLVTLRFCCRGGANRTGDHSWSLRSKTGEWIQPTAIATVVEEEESIFVACRPKWRGFYDPADQNGQQGDASDSEIEGDYKRAASVTAASLPKTGVWAEVPPPPPVGPPLSEPVQPATASQPDPPPADPEELLNR